MKPNRITVLIVGIIAALGIALVACDGAKNEPSNVKAGAEKGVYYYDSAEGEYTLELADGSVAVLTALGSEIRGSYSLNGTKLVITLKGVSTAAKYENDRVEMTYNNQAMTLIRKTEYTVSFESNGGSAVEAVKAINGRSIEKPTDPKYAGHGFVGWYTDEGCTKEFTFGTSKVTGNITLYAKWALPTENDRTVSFDMGEEYKGETPKSVQTVNNRLYDVESPSQSGYTFKGWWISQYDERAKLSYKWESETVIKTDITLYAVWEKNGEKTPNVYVGEKGISWDRQDVAVTLKVEGPEGYGVTENTYGTTAAAEKEIDFKAAPAGDYVITLKVGDKAYSVYYKNKALDQVSGFEVKNNSVLSFAKVENAQSYVISIECGDPTHKHTMMEIGSEPEYDFGNCEMQKDGITFTVYAKADGYAMSTGREYNHEAHLNGVTGYKVNNDGILSWEKVEHAEKYVVQINDGKETEITENSYDVRKYTGEVKVSVYAKAHGYNSVAGSEHRYRNDRLAMPENIGVIGQEISWDKVENATSYEVTIDGKTQTVTENRLNLETLDWQDGKAYSITVKAISATNSSYVSDAVRILYGTEIENLVYGKSVLTWDGLLRAERYEVRVNEGMPQEVTKGQLSAAVTLTGKTNVLSVRMYDADGNASAWSSISVDAFEITLDTQDGKKSNKVYRATGDNLALPEATRVGYSFINWYNAAENGKPLTEQTFNGAADVTVYAYWNANKYDVKLDYGVYGVELAETVSIAYDSGYILPVPDTKDGRMMFIGWYSSSDGNGLKYTDDLGVSVSNWINTTDNVTLHAYFLELFKFTIDGDGYAVSKGPNTFSRLKIPAEYDGKPVVSIAEYGFQSNNSVVEVALPNTIISIPETAFSGSSKIAKYIVYDAGNPDPLFYTDENSGALLYNNYATGAREIFFVPAAATGTFVVPEGITHLGTNSFRTTNVEEVVIATSVTSIAQDVFVNCYDLTTITFAPVPKGEVAKPLNMSPNMIGSNCSAFKNIVLPARLMKFQTDDKPIAEVISWFRTVEKIHVEQGDGDKNPNIAYSSDENGVLLSGDGSTVIYFPIKSALTKYEIPVGVTKIADNAFDTSIGQKATSGLGYKTHLLQEVVFHSNMTEIGERAFFRSYNLSKVSFKSSALPGSCKIGKEAFAYCYNLATVDIQEKGELKAVVNDGVTEYVYEYTESCGISEIGERAFYSCKIGTILLPSTLTVLGKEAFRGNTHLSSLDLGHIGSSLEFGEYVFQECKNLVNVPITANVGLIPLKGVFMGCGVREFAVAEQNPYYEMGEDGVLYNKGQTKIMYYPAGREGAYVIPKTVETITSGVFMDVSNLEEITIPTSVISIGASAFQNCANLSKVTFQTEGKGSNLVIGDNAFNGCQQLNSIELPARTESLGNQCFYKSGLTSITLNEGLKSIGYEVQNGNVIDNTNVFQGLSGLRSIVIPSTVTFIGKTAFSGSGLTEVKFDKPAEGETAKNLIMGASVFSSCAGLQEIELPERLQYIPSFAFSSCVALKKVIIPTTVGNTDGIRGVGVSAFSGCTQLSQLLFAEDIKSDEPTTVDDASATPTARLKDLSFGYSAFANCTSLTEMTLPARISGMYTPYDVFEIYNEYNNYCDLMLSFSKSNNWNSTNFQNIKIQRINVTPGGDNFDSYDGVLYTKDCNEIVYCPQGREGEVEISKNATTIRNAAFSYCHHVTKITFQDANDTSLVDFVIPDTTQTSYRTYFYACTDLKEIDFPARLTTLGKNALYCSSSNSHGISTVKFAPNCKLLSIGDGAFERTLISEIELPAGVTTIGKTPFNDYQSESLTITLPLSLNSTAIANLRNVGGSKLPILIRREGSLIGNIDGIMYSVDDGKRSIAYCDGDPDGFDEKNKTTLTIPYDVEVIAANAFKDIKRYNKVIFEPAPEGTEKVYKLSIDNNAFQNAGITEIELPSRVEMLGTAVFKGCKQLVSVKFAKGYSYSSIPNNTFYEATALNTIDIPDVVSIIGIAAFQKCTDLSNINFGAASTLTSIGANAFNGCTSLESFDIPANVSQLGFTTLGFSEAVGSYTFDGCTSLETVNFLGNNLEYIGQCTFRNCTSLKYINKPENDDKHDAVLPSAITKIGTSAFANTTSLLNISLPAELTYIGVSAFSKSGIQHAFMVESDQCKLEQICNSAFEGSKLRDIYIPNSLTKLCTELKNFSSITFTSSSAFKNCTELETVRFGTSCGLTVIGSSTFEGCTSLEEIKIPTGITRIGDSAFKGCTSLKNVDFSEETVEYIGTIFDGCTALTSVILPESLRSLGTVTGTTPPTKASNKNVFNGCTALEYIKIPSQVTVIHNTLFEGCSALKTVVLHAGISKIGHTVFSGCTSLTTIRYDEPPVQDPDSEEKADDEADGVIDLSRLAIKEIPMKLFLQCSALTTVKLPDGVTKIGTSTFQGCSSLTSIDLPASLTTLGATSVNSDSSVFAGCSSLTTIEIPSGVKVISTKCFMDCNNLTTVKISNVTAIHAFAFSGCPSVTFVKADGGSVGVEDGAVYSGTTLIAYKGTSTTLNVREGTTAIAPYAIGGNSFTENASNLVTVVLPESVKTIGTYAFRNCKDLQSINLENVTKIDTYAFENCSSLGSVTVKGTIGNNAFKGCSGLSSVEFTGTANITVGNSAFENCTSLAYSSTEPLVIPGTVTNLGGSAFKGCTSLKAVDINAKLTGTASCGTAIFANCSALTTVKLGDNVTFINNTAFQNCRSLDSVTMTDKLTTLGQETGGQVFEKCESLESIKLSQGLTFISVKTFNGCKNLKTVIFGDNSKVDRIRNNAFQDCKSLDNLTLPSMLTVLGGTNKNPTVITDVSVFAGCSSLTGIVIPDGVTVIPANTFKNCTSLTSVDFKNAGYISNTAFSGCADTLQLASSGKNVIFDGEFIYIKNSGSTELTLATYLGNSVQCAITAPAGYTVTAIGDYAFYGDTTLTKINLPDTLVTIGSYAFNGCTSLTEIMLPDSVKTIGTCAFKGDSAVTVIELSDSLTTIGDNAFDGCISVESIVIDARTVKTMGQYVFINWTPAQTVYIIGASTRPSGWKALWYSNSTTACPTIVWNYVPPAEEPTV